MRCVTWALPAMMLLGCGDSGGNLAKGTYAAKCQVACQSLPAKAPCTADKQSACTTSCTVSLEGLSTLCAQCMLEHGAWTGYECACTGEACCKDFFGGETKTFRRDGGVCANPCSAGQGECRFDLAAATGSTCSPFCSGKGG